MPINRCQIRNEYSLADPELYKIAGKDDPEALLEGVAMVGLVGVLRQLGDLAQFAAEIFHDLHEEVMSTAARGHTLIARVQQLEAEIPSVEKTLLLQTRHTSFLYNSGIDCHPNLRMDQNLVTQQDLPRFVLDSYEECRGPPRLFLLDKFDIAGAGASLKRYTDPSFFKEAPSSTNRKSDEQRERRTRKVKKRGSRWRNGDTPVTYPSSHAKLHQLFLEENIETDGPPEDTERRVKLKNRQLSVSQPDQNRGRSYMGKILIAGSQQEKTADENCVDSLALTWPFENGCEYSHDIVENGTISSLKEATQTAQNASSLLNNMDMMVTSSMDDFSKPKSGEIFSSEAEGVGGYDHVNSASKIPSTTSKIVLDEESDYGQRQSEIGVDGNNSDGFASEIDNYLDALATTDSEIETDSEGKNGHCNNLKSDMKDSDTIEGKRKLLSNDAQLNDDVTISEDDSASFKGQDCSSFCSVSVDIFAETTAELDASVMSVPSIPNFNPDLVKTPVDDHSMTKEIPGNEPEKHADRSTIAKVNESSEIGLSEEPVPGDEEATLQKISVLNEDLDEVYDAAKPNLPSRIGDDRNANQSAVWSCDGQVADGAEVTHRGHWSHGELFMLDTTGGNSSFYPDSLPDLTRTHDGSVDLLLEASIKPDSDGSSDEEHSSGPGRADWADILDTGLSVNNSFSSDLKHPEIVGPIGSASNKDFCSTSSEELSANHSSVPSFTHCSNFQEQISETMNSGHALQPQAGAESLSNTPEDLGIKEVIADVKSEKEASPPSSFSGTVDTDETNIVSVGSPKDEEIRGYSIVTGNLTPVLDFSEAQEHRQQLSEETDVALLEYHLVEPNEQYQGSQTNCGHPLSACEDKGKAANVATFTRDVNCDGTPIYSDSPATVGDLDKSLIQVLQSDATNDCGHDDNQDNEAILPDDFMIDIPPKLPSNSSYVLPAENNLDFHHDAAEVKIIAIGADGLRQDDDNFQHDNSTLCSFSPLNLKVVQEHVSGKKECCQDGEGSSLRRTLELNALKCVDSLQNTPANLDSRLCNFSSDSLAKHLQNNGKSVVEASPTSESNALNVELITPTMKGLNLLDDESAVKPLGGFELSSQSLHYSHQIQTPHDPHGLSSVSQLSPQCEHTEECSSQSIIKPSPNFVVGHDTLNAHNRATGGVDNSGKSVYALGFPALCMLPTEPQINLDAPPLPPLPPMQWRLSRFQNSLVAPERNMLQHTLDPSQPKHATFSEQSSQDEKYGIEEENLTITTASTSVGSQNGIQLSENGYVAQQGAIALPMLQSTSMAAEGQVSQHTIDFVQPAPAAVLEAPSRDNMKEFRSEDNLSLTIPTSVRCHSGTQDPTNDNVIYSENNMSGVKQEDDPLLIPTSTCYPDGNQMSEGSYQPCGNLHESKPLVEDHFCGDSQIVAEAKVDVEVGSHDEHLKHISQDNKKEVVNFDFRLLPPSNSQPSADLVSPKAGRTNGVQNNAGADTKETLQKKPPRPRNPLIDEVVAIDKSKLRKVERVKSPLELKPGGDLLLEQMQLKKVERVKPLVEGKTEDGESSLEHVQLRKAGERVIPEVEQSPDETKSPGVQLRKVPKRAHPLLVSKSMDRDSLLEQIRAKSFNLKPAAMSRPNLQGPSVQGPRANLKVAAILEKASNIRQAMAGSDEEDDGDSWSDC